MRDDRGGWFTRLFRRAPRRAGIDGEQVRRILEAYAACLGRRAPDRIHRSERDLPCSKEEIGRAILHALRFATSREIAAPLRHGFAELERFLADDEWALVDEYERLAAVGGLGGGMTEERREAARRIVTEVEARRARRVELLTILDREHPAPP